MQDFLLYSAIPGSGRLFQIATLDLLNFIKNESWVPCKMQNGGMEAAEVISSLGGFRRHLSKAFPLWGRWHGEAVTDEGAGFQPV